MTALELLAPARNADIGIAAVCCGADAVYIAGPAFGARKDAGNPISEVGRLCLYAHRFGVKVFLTVNISLRDDELDEVHRTMLEAQEAGVDAFIIRDPRIALWQDITVPVHASTQCAIRSSERARWFEDLGCSRIVLERELSLAQVREICNAVDCEVEFFVHGALCVCYSGECRLSEHLDGRSADRGECIQACRSLYDLADAGGRILVRNKALLSLKDFQLIDRLEDLADAGVKSFKIEGRLKNASYVKNVVRAYSDAIDSLCRKHPERYCRASWGHPVGGFKPDTAKTFNRGYIQLWMDGRRGRWSSMDAPKSMGEAVGTVESIRPEGESGCSVRIRPQTPGLNFANGDGFAFVTADGITGFRADTASGNVIFCRRVPDLKAGTTLYRNVNSTFEKSLENDMCARLIDVRLRVEVCESGVCLHALTDDGREVTFRDSSLNQAANNPERSLSMLKTGLSKCSDIYRFSVESIDCPGNVTVPLMSSSYINSLRRSVAGEFDKCPLPAETRVHNNDGKQFGMLPQENGRKTLMKSKYCIKYELGLCEKHFGAAPCGPLHLLNNGRRLDLHFDCLNCEMTLTSGQK